MKLLKITPAVGIAWAALAVTPVLAQADAGGLVDAARATVKAAWEKEIQPYRDSALGAIKIQAVERRNRLAPGVHLVHAFAETSWWKHSQHYLLLLRAAETGFEVVYRFDGGSGGKGLGYRLVDLGSGNRRFVLEISDHGFEDDDTTGTWTILVLYLPESDRFVEVFRELTSYRPTSAHGHASKLSYRQADGPMKDVAVRTELLEDGGAVDTIESIFVWQESVYQGIMPLPEAWRAELPKRIERQAQVPEIPDKLTGPEENPP